MVKKTPINAPQQARILSALLTVTGCGAKPRSQ
jgi:hypothetical protein